MIQRKFPTDLRRRAGALALSTAMLFSCAGALSACGTEEPVKEKPVNVYRTEILFESYYSYNDTAEGRTEFRDLQSAGDRLILTGYTYDEYWNSKELFYAIDPQTGEMTEITVPAVSAENNEYRNYIRFADDGTMWYTVNSGFYDEAAQTYLEKCSLYHADSSGSILAEADLYDLLGVKSGEQYLYLQNMQVIGDSVFLAMDSGVYTVSAELSGAKKIELDDFSYILTILPMDGDLYAAYYTQSEYKLRMVPIDGETHTVGAPTEIASRAANYLYNAKPSDTYDFVYQNTIGIYGYDIATDTETELLNWVNSDINASYMNSTCIQPDGTVFTLMREYETDGSAVSLLKLTRIPDEEIVEKYLLTYGGIYIGSDILDAIIDFNRTSEEYRITVRDYSDYNSEENQWTGAVTQFNNDIISGNIPDIIQASSEMPMANYAAKGLFADLNAFIAEDPVFAKEDLYENILDAFSVNGKLYQLAPFFNVRTLAAKSSIVGENDGWTMDTLLSSLSYLEEGSDPFGGEITRTEFLNALCASVRDQFIDPDTGMCSFNSAEFIKILEFAKTLPEKTVWETTNWDEVGEDFYTDREMMYRENRALLYQVYLNNYSVFWEIQQGVFGERISLVGYPNEAMQGATIYPSTSFAVSSQSLCKEGAWAFLSEYFADQKNVNPDSLYRFSIFRSVNRQLAEKALAYHDNYWYEQQYGNGSGVEEDIAVALPAVEEVIAEEVVEAVTDAAEDIPVEDEIVAEPWVPEVDLSNKTWTYWIGNSEIDIGMMTEEAVARVDSFLESLSQIYQHDSAMMDIIQEEASSFFSGAKSAEEVANLIQSRVSIYVAESR